nr:MAG TPA: hypothetical protein [Caudoviricetes sp.]
MQTRSSTTNPANSRWSSIHALRGFLKTFIYSN